MFKVNLAILLSATLLGGCVYERNEGSWSPNPGPGTADAPPPRYASPPPMQASVPPDRVTAQDLARLNPGTGVAGPDAEPYRPQRAAPQGGRIFVQAASFVTRDQAERSRRSIANLGPAGVYTAYVDDQLRYRVRIGPLATPERSERVRAALVRRGYGDAIVVRD